VIYYLINHLQVDLLKRPERLVDIKPGNPIYTDLIAKWAKHGVTVQDAQAAIIGFLAEKGPLSMVVYSGNQSLQGWFYCAKTQDFLSGDLPHLENGQPLSFERMKRMGDQCPSQRGIR
jgi:hypothetical protein